MAVSWTDERVNRLKELWKKGKSAAQIAQELGGVTRSSVIGKLHRLGLGANDREESARRKSNNVSVSSTSSSPPAKPVVAKPRPKQVATEKENIAPQSCNTSWDDAARAFLRSITQEDTTRTEALAKLRKKFPDREFAQVGMVNVARGMGIRFVDVGSPRTAADDDLAERVRNLEESARQRASRNGQKPGVLDLTERICKWPIGDPQDTNSVDFWFCGQPVGTRSNGKKSPYCQHHTEVAFISSAELQRRRRMQHT